MKNRTYLRLETQICPEPAFIVSMLETQKRLESLLRVVVVVVWWCVVVVAVAFMLDCWHGAVGGRGRMLSKVC